MCARARDRVNITSYTHRQRERGKYIHVYEKADSDHNSAGIYVYKETKRKARVPCTSGFCPVCNHRGMNEDSSYSDAAAAAADWP